LLGATAVVLLWDVLLAGQISRARRQARDFLAVTALTGLLIAPALIVAVASSTLLGGEAVALVGWLWPATLALFVAQSGIALWRRLITSLLAVPIFVANLLIFLAALVRYLTAWIPDLPPAVLGIDAAHAAALSALLGYSSVGSPLAIQLPLLAPAYPARWRISKSVRAVLALTAGVAAVFVVLEYPRSVRAAATFDRLANQRMQERRRGDLELGLRILPTLGGVPPAFAVSHDLSLADSLGASVLTVVVAPSGTGGLALDSLANALAGVREDSIRIAVTLGYGAGDREAFLASPSRYRDTRLAALEQIVRRVRPDVLVPALEPNLSGRRVLGFVGLDWWTDYLRRAARQTRTLRPRTQLAVSLSSYTTEDSLLYRWALLSPDVDLVGFSFAPSLGGGSSLAARLRAAEQWMRGTETRKEHWVFSVRSYPLAFGESNQARAVVGAFAWATRQPRIRVLVAEGAGDYDELVGLRDARGRLRPAVALLSRTRLALRETALE
jgi:hypothetical protein